MNFWTVPSTVESGVLLLFLWWWWWWKLLLGLWPRMWPGVTFFRGWVPKHPLQRAQSGKSSALSGYHFCWLSHTVLYLTSNTFMSTHPSMYLSKSIKSSWMSPLTSQAQDMSHTRPRRMVNHPFLPTGPTPYWLVCHTVSSGNCFHKSLLLEIPSGHVEGCTMKVIGVDLFWGTHGRIPVQSSKLVVALCFNGQYDPCYRINVSSTKA